MFQKKYPFVIIFQRTFLTIFVGITDAVFMFQKIKEHFVLLSHFCFAHQQKYGSLHNPPNYRAKVVKNLHIRKYFI